ncbi:MAG TPA: alpha/beta hydrolase [Candidatus Binataceae bacterium]|nr:alpha/beta hydrolase [Candidatus Binataceae bacterium]
MPLDPQMKSVLDQMAAAKLAPFHQMTPEEARRQMARRAAPEQRVDAVSSQDRTVPGPGGDVPVRVYTPEGAGPFGALVYYHGGGWVLGNIAMTDLSCRLLAKASGCVVVSVDYRLAPEHKFPVPAEDCYASVKWLSDNASSVNCDPSRIAVGGTSAGANLAAATTLMARDRGGPPIAFQLLVYPATRRELNTNSHRQFASDNYYILSRADMEWFWNHYLANPDDALNPYACPDRAATLEGLPPALTITAEFDPLRDEGEAYAARLREDGVASVLKRFNGVTHGFFGMPLQIDQAKQAIEEAAAALRLAIG